MTLRAVRRERRPIRVMLLADLDSRGVPGPCAARRCGYAVQFRHADYSVKSVRLSRSSSRGSYPPIVGFLSRRLPASSAP